MAILPLQLARVSNNMRAGVAQQRIASTQNALLKVQNELSSGKRLNAPSDDPGDSAVVLQLRKTLEQRLAFSDNLTRAASHLSEVDSTLGDVTSLLQEAQSIASANVGSDVTPEQRAGAATIIENLYNQMLSTANRQFEGVYLFGGERSTDAPFVPAAGGVKFVGSQDVLANAFDENAILPFMVDGSGVFGALSTRVEGSQDLSPDMTAQTRLVDLDGALLEGVRKGSIQIDNGTDSVIVDLSAADTIGDVIGAINNAGLSGITASISGNGLRINTGGTETVSVNEVGGGMTAADLGVLQATPLGAGIDIVGANLQPRLTPLTPLLSLSSGFGLDTSGITITNGDVSAAIDFGTAVTIEDMLNLINGAGVGVRASINEDGTGINILNSIQGTEMTIGENGGSTAAELGVRSFALNSPLTELNFGAGVRTVAGADFRVTRRDGTSFDVDVDGATDVQDVLAAINAADAGGGVNATFAATGNGIVLTDSSVGGGTLTVTPLNFSNAAADLGLTQQAAVGPVISGTDVNRVKAVGIFSHMAKLRDSLHSGDQAGITEAAEMLKLDYDRVVQVRGETGARVQDIDARTNRLQDQNVATKALLSSMEDADFTDAITRFQTLQDALQATLQTTAAAANLSLLDFLG